MGRSNWKRITAGLLCALMVYGAAAPVLANPQQHISNLSISVTPSTAGDYKVKLDWFWPPSTDTSPERATSYNIHLWNVTARQTIPPGAYASVPDADAQTGMGDARAYEETFTNLSPGSLYRFRVSPIHMHPGTGTPPGPDTPAPYSNAVPPAEALLLTDIRVEASGAGQEMTVVWDNPTYDGGREVFTGYNIYYLLYGGGSAPIAVQNPTAALKVVTSTDPKLIHRADGKLSYTFNAPGVQQGMLYSVAVEPLYNSATPFRFLTSKTTITDGARVYPLTFSAREYRTNNAYIRPSLHVEESGQSMLRLFWDSFALSNLYFVDLQIFESASAAMTDKQNIGTYSDLYAKNSSDMYTARPQNARYYQLEVTYKETSASLQTQKMVSDVVMYMPNYEAFKPTKPNILEIKDAAGGSTGMEILWEAFTREPYNDNEAQIAGTGRFLDQDVEYDIWVADSLAYFDDPTFMNFKTVDSLDAHILQTQDYRLGSYTKPAYTQTIRTYATLDETGAYVFRPVEDNKLYYVRVVARRTNSLLNEESEPAYDSYFIMPAGNITTRPPVVSRPPLRIKTVNGVEQISDTAFTIQWDKKWFEIYDDATKTWYTEVGFDGNTPVYGDGITDAIRQAGKVLQLNDPAYQITGNLQAGKDAIEAHINGLLASPPAIMPPLRLVDLNQAKTEIRVVETTLLMDTGYDAYIASLTDEDWETITPAGDPLHPEYTVTRAHAPTAGPLNPNKTYTVLFRPYVTLADGKKAAYQPSALTATTLATRLDPEVTPTVPVLEPDGQTDVTIRVRFPYSAGLQYELRWSEVMSDYPDGGQTLSSADVLANGFVSGSGVNDIMHVTVNGLFPSSTYYVWVRSVAAANGKSTPSGWSNPISMTTLAIAPPGKPQGLGLAAENHMDIYNKENNAALLPADADYLNIVWLRDMLDPETGDGTLSGAGTASLLSSPNFRGIYIAKFEELIGNHPYYIRAKTRLTITKNGSDNVATYQYIVQFAPAADFLDAIEIVVGTAPGSGDSVSAESGWCDVVRLFTRSYKGEYDGDKNPDMYPLPDSDFEIVYDRATDTLTYRFRSNGKDTGGNADNMVDQRFISRLITEGTAVYELDMTGYLNLIARNRVLSLPYTIVKAMEDLKVSLALTAGDMVFTFKPGFANTAQVKALRDYGTASQIIIALNESPTDVVRPSSPSSFATTPQRLSVTVKTPTSEIALTNLAVPAALSMKLTNRSVAYDSNIGAFYYDKSQNAWARLDGKYDSVMARVNTAANKAGDYAVIASAPPAQTGSTDAGANASAYVVNSALHFTDLKAYNPSAYVNAWQLNKIISALANGQKDVAVNAALTEAEQQALTKAGLFVSGGTTVSRENAVAALVKLYEVKTRFPVQGYPLLAASPYQDINSAASAAKLPLLKAGYLGFFGDGATAAPKQALTFKDMLLMVDIIIQDAGL